MSPPEQRSGMLAVLGADPLAWVAAAAVGFGVAVRAWVIAGPMGTPDLDAATVAYQAQEFLDGRFGVFFLNQPYGGTLEVFLVSGAFGLGGANTAMLKLVPLVLHVVGAVLTWRIARRVTDDPLARLLAPLILWIFPAGMVWNSTKERGFYGIALVLSAATVLLALRVVQRGAVPVDVVALGLVVGLGWWTTPLLAPVALVACTWALSRSADARREVVPLVGSAVLGAAPWLVWNASNSWESITGGRLEGLDWLEGESAWLRSLGLLSGTATPWDLDRNLLPWWLAAVVLGLMLVVGALRTRRSVGWLLPGIIVVAGVTSPLNLVLPLSPGAPRYLYPLMPVVAVLVAVLAPERRRRPDAVWAGGLLAAAAALTWWGLVGMDHLANRPNANGFVASPGIHEVVDYLERQDISVVTTDTSGMQIHFFSEGEIVASSFGAPRVKRFEQVALVAPETTFVLEGVAFDNRGRLRRWAEFGGTPYVEERIGSYSVFTFDRRVTPEEAGLRVFGGRPQPDAGE
ncbi:MAG: hypothetical protein R2754_11275 [Microthrixaceae bacterium]